MPRFRMINCDFINASSFKVNVSNKGKLLYLMMCMNADDKGFVDSVQDIINALTNNEKEFNKTISLELLENTYTSALDELIQRGYLFEFTDNHNNKIYLVKHWFYHNKLKSGLWTNYKNFLELVYLEGNEYKLGKKPLKEDKTKQDKTLPYKTKHNKTNKEEEPKPTETDELDEEYPFELTEEEKERLRG